MFDTNGNELIGRDQWFNGMAIILKGSIEDKIKFLFRVMDLDDTGKISKTDLETVLNCIVSAQQCWQRDGHSTPNGHGVGNPNHPNHTPSYPHHNHLNSINWSNPASPQSPRICAFPEHEENTTGTVPNGVEIHSLNQQNHITDKEQAVMEGEKAVEELLEDAWAHCPDDQFLSLRVFAGWIVEHAYLWEVIEDTFKLSSTYNSSITPGLRRRRSDSVRSMSSVTSGITYTATNGIPHGIHSGIHSGINGGSLPMVHRGGMLPQNDNLLIDNVLAPKESFSNQMKRVGSHGSLSGLKRAKTVPVDDLNHLKDLKITHPQSGGAPLDEMKSADLIRTNPVPNHQSGCHPHSLGAVNPVGGGNGSGNVTGNLPGNINNNISKSLFQFKFDATPLVPDMFGYLTKIGRRLSLRVRRWYLLHSNFLYVFKSATDTKPRHVILLHGCQIRAVSAESSDERLKHGIELVIGINTIRHSTKVLFAANASDQQRWISALKQSGDAFVIEDFFNIHDKLGSGKFSTVFRATDKKSGTEHAVKIIKRRSLSRRENDALRTEIAVLRLLNHPNIISIQHVFETVSSICIVMEYVKGGDLFDRIVELRRFSEIQAKQVMFKLLSVILYLHRRGIVHRDLKPENILVTSKKKMDSILVIDFGLSSFFTPKEMLKSPCGTLSYVAPEVLKGAGYGKQVDLWSAGVILYVMLRGKLPFDSTIKKDKTILIRKVIAGRFSMRNEIWKGISNGCKDLIVRLLTVDPQKRISAQNALKHSWFDSLRVNPNDLTSVPETQNNEKTKSL